MPGPNAGLLQWVLQNSNSLAAVKTAAPALLNLKNSIQGVPFGLNVPGMSALMGGSNILQGLLGMLGMIGGLASVPGGQSVMGAVQNGTATAQQLINALGQGACFAAALGCPSLVQGGQAENSSSSDAAFSGPPGTSGQAPSVPTSLKDTVHEIYAPVFVDVLARKRK